VPTPREQLAANLKQLRLRAGLTGEQLAGRLRVSQPKISRVETGKSVPTATDIEAWVRVTNADTEEVVELSKLLDQIATEARSWRLVNRLGLVPRQHEIADLEQSAHTICVFQPVMVPGLLQIADYARRVMEMTYTAGPDIAPAVAVRMERQTILYDQAKRFEFIITEGALRWRPGPPDMMRAQLDRLLSVATLPNVTLELVPHGETPIPLLHPFVLFDMEGEALVTAETYSTELQIRDPSDVARYRQVLERLRTAAVPDATEPLRALATSWQGSEPDHPQ
jgi:transcriptional regulator with XRE-family HTH domain